MSRVLSIFYGVICYAIFIGTFLYFIAFAGNLPVPTRIDFGASASRSASILIDIALIAVFGLQHSLMARASFKLWWTRLIPEPIERATYVLFSSAALALLCWQWRPIAGEIWNVSGVWAAVLWLLFWAGWGIVLLSTFLIDHFELTGLSQVWRSFRRQSSAAPEFKMPFLYGFVRHPLYFGLVLAFWSAPRMTVGHLLFAVLNTGYILIGIRLEERDLMATFGAAYGDYRRRVPMLIPAPKKI